MNYMRTDDFEYYPETVFADELFNIWNFQNLLYLLVEKCSLEESIEVIANNMTYWVRGSNG